MTDNLSNEEWLELVRDRVLERVGRIYEKDDVRAVKDLGHVIDEIILEAIATHLGHFGFYPERTRGDHLSAMRERAFAEKWIEINKRGTVVPGIFWKTGEPKKELGNSVSFPGAFVYDCEPKDAAAIATVFQWLGSNVGFCYLEEILGSCGYVVERQDQRPPDSDFTPGSLRNDLWGAMCLDEESLSLICRNMRRGFETREKSVHVWRRLHMADVTVHEILLPNTQAFFDSPVFIGLELIP